MELFRKITFDEINLEDANELRNMFKTNLKEISKERFKSEDKKSVLENIKLRYDSRQAVIKLSNYLMNILQLHLKLNAKQNMKKD